MPKIYVGFLRVVQKLCTCVIYLIIALCVTTADGPSSCTLTNQSHLGRCLPYFCAQTVLFFVFFFRKNVHQPSRKKFSNHLLLHKNKPTKKSSQKLGMKQFFWGGGGEEINVNHPDVRKRVKWTCGQSSWLCSPCLFREKKKLCEMQFLFVEMEG